MSLITYESCHNTVRQIANEARLHSFTGNLTRVNLDNMMKCCNAVYSLHQERKHSEPMVLIGIYIAVASLYCVLAMMADLLHGFRNRKFWFPCKKYFTINAASLTIIAVAMKQPTDLSLFNASVDVTTKLGSLVFMTTMMAHLMPSIASMNNMQLLENGTGFLILVITLIVNMLLQLKTGHFDDLYWSVWWKNQRLVPSFLFSGLGGVVCLLTILIITALSVPIVKQILEFRYRQVAHTTSAIASNTNNSKNVEELMQHVRRHWVMARTSDLQFMMANTPLCRAASVISVFVSVIHLMEVSYAVTCGRYKQFDSAYDWTMLPILIIQTIGIVVGNIAPLFRCFGALGFELSFKWTMNHINVFKVEKYWTQNLSVWKENHLAFPSHYGRVPKAVVHNSKNLILSLCTRFIQAIVVLGKTIGLIPVILVLVVNCLSRSLKAQVSSAEARHNTVHEPANENNTDTDISNYILQLQDETKLASHTVKQISNSFNRLMQKAEKKPKPNNLTRLLQKSTGFEGVETFDSDQVQPLPSVEVINCWSLPVVTLTCIAIALPGIRKDTLDFLISGVREGLSYTRLVDECLALETVNIQKLISNFWDEVDVNCRWLGTTLKGDAYIGTTLKELLNFFNNKAKETVAQIQNNTNEGALENSRHKLFAANSMYRITQRLILNDQAAGIIEQNSEDQLFDMLSSTIADIIAACLTNLPQVIQMKCNEHVIEKRETSVEAAVELLGQAKEIINNIQTRELPNIDPNKTALIEEWRNFFKESVIHSS